MVSSTNLNIGTQKYDVIRGYPVSYRQISTFSTKQNKCKHYNVYNIYTITTTTRYIDWPMPLRANKPPATKLELNSY